MKILAIDTTSNFLCLGFFDGKNIYEYNLDSGRRLSALLVPTIKRVLDVLGFTIGDIDYFACGLGPGSFTGIRVGVSAIKGFAWASKKPVVGISTLDIIAQNAAELQNPYIMPIIDAKRSLIFCSIYRKAKDGLKRVSGYMLLDEKEVLGKTRPKTLFLGSAAEIYKDNISKQIKGAKFLSKDYWYPQPRNIIKLALQKIKEGKISNAFDLEPIYIYPKDCQVRKI